MNRTEIYLEAEIKAHAKYLNGSDGWIIEEKNIEPLVKKLVELIKPDSTPSQHDRYKAAQNHLMKTERMEDEHGRVFYFGMSVAEALIIASGNKL